MKQAVCGMKRSTAAALSLSLNKHIIISLLSQLEGFCLFSEKLVYVFSLGYFKLLHGEL